MKLFGKKLNKMYKYRFVDKLMLEEDFCHISHELIGLSSGFSGLLCFQKAFKYPDVDEPITSGQGKNLPIKSTDGSI